MRRLWMRSSKVSQVLEPSPQGVLRVVTLRFLVGRRTGPLTLRPLERARSRSSVQTFSRAWTLREVRVIRMRWAFYISTSVSNVFEEQCELTGRTYGRLAKILVLLVRHLDIRHDSSVWLRQSDDGLLVAERKFATAGLFRQIHIPPNFSGVRPQGWSRRRNAVFFRRTGADGDHVGH